MRVLCLEDAKLGSLEVIEIIDIGYDDDLTNVKEKENYKPFKDFPISGLYMISSGYQDYLYIKGVSLQVCNSICREIMMTGYYDLSRYGQYETYEPAD